MTDRYIKYVCIEEFQPQFCKVGDIIYIDFQEVYGRYELAPFFDAKKNWIDFISYPDIDKYLIPFAKYRENRINELF